MLVSGDNQLGETHIWLDGRVLTDQGIESVAPINYGHFTVMQVRSGAVRGIALHMARIDQAHRELFGHGLDLDAIRMHWNTAVRDHPDASLRAIYHDTLDGQCHELLVVGLPASPATTPQRLLPVHYVRPFAHIKHVGTFAQIVFRRQAVQSGYDDALLVSENDEISETATANIGFIRDHNVVWPALPSLHGTGQQLLEAALSKAEIPSIRAVVRLSDLSRYHAVFTINSTGIVPIAQIADQHFTKPETHINRVMSLWQALPWESL